MQPPSDDDKLDAQRYRWLRGQHWSDNVVAVVQQPKDTIKVGAQCYSAARLDALIDKELKK